ncbi:MAG: radical SAM family heme chaperone HemW [Ruminococcaceae bacterium]|nr:radical SAM family heme chaperone HemW [Oscillospiraceae bacterium]
MRKLPAQKDRPLGLYIHIPFCQSKCAYCDFYSLAHSEEKMDAYVSALSRHLTEVAPRAALHLVDTVYFGGGTPSYLGVSRLTQLLKIIQKHYRLAKDAEITLEANPDSAGDWKALRALRRAGFNRISLGVQTTDDALLRQLGRIHTAAQAQQAVEAARRAKLENLSLDLIYGLPGQTMEHWQKTLADAVAMNPEHLSCYGLKVEEGTPLWHQNPANLPNDDLQAEMYLYTVSFLQQAGYQQYEISNFAKPGRESRHNLKYWTLQEYAGFGPGAHSDFGGVRYGYQRDLEGYLRGDLVLSESEIIDPLDRDMEYLMLYLRTNAGLDGKHFETRFRQRFAPLEQQLRQYAQMGLACQDGAVWKLTPKGYLVSNQIIGQLQEILVQEKLLRLNRAAQKDYRIIQN